MIVYWFLLPILRLIDWIHLDRWTIMDAGMLEQQYLNDPVIKQ